MSNHYTYNTTLSDYDPTSLADLFVYPATVVSNFYSMVLLGIFFIVTLGVYNLSRSDLRKGDIIASATVGAWITTVISVVMSLIDGMIGRTPIMISLVSSIIFTILLFLTSNRE